MDNLSSIFRNKINGFNVDKKVFTNGVSKMDYDDGDAEEVVGKAEKAVFSKQPSAMETKIWGASFGKGSSASFSMDKIYGKMIRKDKKSKSNISFDGLGDVSMGEQAAQPTVPTQPLMMGLPGQEVTLKGNNLINAKLMRGRDKVNEMFGTSYNELGDGLRMRTGDLDVNGIIGFGGNRPMGDIGLNKMRMGFGMRHMHGKHKHMNMGGMIRMHGKTNIVGKILGKGHSFKIGKDIGKSKMSMLGLKKVGTNPINKILGNGNGSQDKINKILGGSSLRKPISVNMNASSKISMMLGRSNFLRRDMFSRNVEEEFITAKELKEKKPIPVYDTTEQTEAPKTESTPSPEDTMSFSEKNVQFVKDVGSGFKDMGYALDTGLVGDVVRAPVTAVKKGGVAAYEGISNIGIATEAVAVPVYEFGKKRVVDLYEARKPLANNLASLKQVYTKGVKPFGEFVYGKAKAKVDQWQKESDELNAEKHKRKVAQEEARTAYYKKLAEEKSAEEMRKSLGIKETKKKEDKDTETDKWFKKYYGRQPYGGWGAMTGQAPNYYGAMFGGQQNVNDPGIMSYKAQTLVGGGQQTLPNMLMMGGMLSNLSGTPSTETFARKVKYFTGNTESTNKQLLTDLSGQEAPKVQIIQVPAPVQPQYPQRPVYPQQPQQPYAPSGPAGTYVDKYGKIRRYPRGPYKKRRY